MKHYLSKDLKILVSETSGKKTASALIYTGACLVTGITLVTNDSADAALVLYDNTAASGTQPDELQVAAEKMSDSKQYGSAPLKFENGVYAGLSGTGASYYVHYFVPDEADQAGW